VTSAAPTEEPHGGSPATAAADRATSTEERLAIDGATLMMAPVAIYGVDLLGEVCFWNHAAESLFGWSADEVLGQPVPFLPDDMVADSLDRMAMLLAGESFSEVEYPAVHRDGHPLALISSGATLNDDDGQPIAFLAFSRDATPQHKVREALQAAEHKWRSLAWRTADTITIAEPSGRIVETVVSARAMLGYPIGWWTGKVGFEVLHPDDISRARQLWTELVAVPGNWVRTTLRARHNDGHYEQIEFTGTNLLDDPLINGIVITNRTVSPTRQAEALLADEARIFELIARDEPLTAVFDEIVRMIEYHSGGATALFLMDADRPDVTVAAPGSAPPEIVDAICRQVEIIRELDSIEQTHDLLVIENFRTNPITAEGADYLEGLGFRSGWGLPLVDNRTQKLSGFIATVVPEARRPTEHERKVVALANHLGALAIGRDRWQRELEEQAHLDSLTRLPNRSLIFQTLEAAMARSRANRTSVTVMVLDLDRFKYINDSLGHAAGDLLITQVADRLRSVLRSTDLVGRMSADEFVVIFGEDAGLTEAELAATRFRQVMGDPFHLDTNEVFLTASIGLATSTTGREDADTLLRHADSAMFRAKELGRDRLVVYDERLRTRALDRLALDRDLRLALDRDQLVLHFQPEVSCATGAIVGAEALVRWEHPERGLIPPDGFIGVAEETGVIVPIGHWVLDEAVRQARAWTDAYPEHEAFSVSVNLSARQLINRSLVDTVAFVLTRYDWPPSHLTLELTESILIEDRDATLYVLNRLRMLGVRLAIDDFGTGFASLDYLHRLHVDMVKIDRSFITPLDEHGRNSPVATAMVHMAKAFDLVVTAEGVEDERQLQGVRALGCDTVQGFLFSRPLPAEDFELLLGRPAAW
jgi:diguanylate cyclase (GGDEF)-like protein/PAS domain S-box-containing protein